MTKEKYGIITRIGDTRVYVDKRPFKRDERITYKMREDNLVVNDEVIISFDESDNVLSIRRKPKPPSEIIDADGVQVKKLHMEQTGSGTGLPPAGGGVNNEMHMQPVRKETPVEPRMWIPDDEKNNFILMQNVLARSVEIVNAHWNQYEQEKMYVDNLDTRLKMIEKVSDRLFRYVKTKVEKERVNKK